MKRVNITDFLTWLIY